MNLHEAIIVRYREAGHVRFELPACLFEPETLAQINAGLSQIEGIYRVDVFPKQRKLSLRYLTMVLDFKALAKRLAQILENLETSEPTQATNQAHRNVVEQVNSWLSEKAEEVRETLQAAGILLKQGSSFGGMMPGADALQNFFTDILVLYLLKKHWRMVLLVWARSPWLYKYEWMASGFMAYLLVRSRRTQIS